MKRTIVVGGGPAGLSCALALADRGGDVVVLEQATEPGGKVRTRRVGDWQVETGPAAVLDDAPATQSVIGRLGLTSDVVRADAVAQRRYIQQQGALVAVPEKPPQIFTTPLLSLRGRLRLLREPWTRRAPAGVDESVAEFGRRHLGPEAVERLLAPMVSGVFAGDVERLSLASAFPRMAEMERQHRSLARAAFVGARERRRSGRGRAQMMSLRGGLGRISDELARALGERVRLGATVTQLSRVDDRWRVRTATDELVGDRVVLAIPQSAARALLQSVDAALADDLAHISSVPVAAVCVGYRAADIPRALDGVGFLLARAERSPLLGVLWMTSIFGDAGQAPTGSVLLRGLFGGAHHPDVMQLSDDALISELRRQLARTVGVSAAPLFTNVVRWPEAIAQYEVGHAARLARLRGRGDASQLFFVGQPYDGIGLNDVLRDGQALGARLAQS